MDRSPWSYLFVIALIGGLAGAALLSSGVQARHGDQVDPIECDFIPPLPFPQC